MNALIGAMFASVFLVIAHTNPTIRRARWFALAYALGMLEPISNLAIVLGAPTDAMRVLGYVGFLLALVGMSLALSYFYERRPMWRMAGAIVAGGTLFRLLTLDGPRDAWYLAAYQSWYAVGAALCAWTILRHAPRSRTKKMFYAIFVVISLHFPVKAIFSILLGIGRTERDYTQTTYAVVSQTSSGVLLVAAGLLLLVGLMQSVVRRSDADARRDPLTGLPNRRAMDEWLEPGRASAKAGGWVALIDIDHFKAFNDRFGHGAGDDVLCKVAECFGSNLATDARLARIGGEEFVLVLPDSDRGSAFEICESLRHAIACMEAENGMGVTVSIGLTARLRDETMATTLRRADTALYRAKEMGRNRCEISAGREEWTSAPVVRKRPELVSVA
ncbi:diguanylate cyclase [Erythrobacter sp. 3-20A1M]|uniref:GGDEF domain-containing protein n=1 Tax=Erythrobacter sp. 3-20A1M TaxID=2653850 RepID=UPI001BFC458B|nr:diguanylate cyclase [Erythrobacter sp. 3-20A1M]